MATQISLPRLQDMRAIDRVALICRITGSVERRPSMLDDDELYEAACERRAASRSTDLWEAALAALPPAEAKRRRRKARELRSIMAFLKRTLPKIQRREELRQRVLDVASDVRIDSRKLPAALLKSVRSQRTAAYAMFDLGAATHAVAHACRITDSHARNYRSGWYDVRAERIVLRVTPDAVSNDDALDLRWWTNQTIEALHTARDDIDHLPLASRALALLGAGLGVL